MLVYFDESYNEHFLVYGALFAPHSGYLHQGLLDIKDRHGFRPEYELKYTTVKNNKHLAAAKDCVDLFFSSTSWFRCVVINLKDFEYDYYGTPSEPLKIKKARAYKKFAEMLLGVNVKSIKDATLLCDQMTRCQGDEFLEKLRELYQHVPNRSFSQIAEVDSSLVQYQVNQINDILMGAVFSEHAAITSPYKVSLRAHIASSLGVPDLGHNFWGPLSKASKDEKYPKFQVWCWETKKA